MCCSDDKYPKRNQVSPGNVNSDVSIYKCGRKNGWILPLHPLQVIGWFCIILFGVTHFSIIAFYLPIEWRAAGIIIPICGFIIHIIYHLLAVSLDPADPNVRLKGYFIKSEFDRNKHKHVIENYFCYICQTKVSSRSKHCSICNKCVSDFDHHCKWLNNCVGGRNYRLFLGSCITAFITALILFIMDAYIVALYSIDRFELLRRSGNPYWSLYAKTCKEAVLIFIIVNGLLLLIAMILLGHLLIFHSYLLCHRMSTYDYIIRNRDRNLAKDSTTDIESAYENTTPPPPLKSGYHHENHYNVPAAKRESNAYELAVMNDKEKVENGRVSRGSIPGEVIEDSVTVKKENVLHFTNKTYNDLKEDEVESNLKKKKKFKHRTPSKVELLQQSDFSDHEEEITLAGSPSLKSINSKDSELERYNNNRNEMVLENFKSPELDRAGIGSRPTVLKEDNMYSPNINQDHPRNESIVSRPIAPSPKTSFKVSNEQFLPNLQRHSQSSLSTVNLIDLEEDTKTKTPRLSPTKEESSLSKSSSASTKENYQNNLKEVNYISQNEPNTFNTPINQGSSQISLSNAKYSVTEKETDLLSRPSSSQSAKYEKPLEPITTSTNMINGNSSSAEETYAEISPKKSNADKQSLSSQISLSNLIQPQELVPVDKMQKKSENGVVEKRKEDSPGGSASSLSKMSDKTRSASKLSVHVIQDKDGNSIREEVIMNNVITEKETLDNEEQKSNKGKTSLSSQISLSNPIHSNESVDYEALPNVALSSAKGKEQTQNSRASSVSNSSKKSQKSIPSSNTSRNKVHSDNENPVTDITMPNNVLKEEIFIEEISDNESLKVKEPKTTENIKSEDEHFIFEDDFASLSEQNNAFLQESLFPISTDSLMQTNIVPLATENENRIDDMKEKEKPVEEKKPKNYDIDHLKLKSKQNSQFSFGSDTDGSDKEVPLALLSEETNTYELKDSLNRVKKLSDAFPSALEQEKLKKRTLPSPYRPTESMAQISVVEYNRKKKLRKKRPIVGGKQRKLPPLKGVQHLPNLSEEDAV